MGGRNAKEWTCVQGAVVPEEPGSPPPRESEDESGLRESQQPAPSRTAVELGITPPSASLDPRDVVGTMACTCVYTCEQHVIKCVHIFAPVNVSVCILCVLILHRFTSIYTEVLSV